MNHSDQSDNVSQRILILCDFDGTISTKDTVNRLVRSHLTSPEWRFHVKKYLLGDIGSKEVYAAVAPMMSMTQDHLDQFVLEHAALDKGFPVFLDWARKRGVDVMVVSDGFDATIRTLFKNHGISDLRIFANSLKFQADGSVLIDHPYANPTCGICGTCKLKVLNKAREDYEFIIVIGDGESDRHAAQEADLVLALKDLFQYCARNGIPAIRIDGFHEVPHLLSREIAAVVYDLDGTLIDSLDEITSSFNHMFRNLGYPEMTREEVARRTSLSLIDFLKSFLRPDEIEIGIKYFRDHYSQIFRSMAKMMPGAAEVIETLDGNVAQGIISNKKGHFARIIGEVLGFEHKMKLIIGAEDGFKAKPAPDMFLKFFEDVKVSPENAVYIGDSPIDIHAGHNAGVDVFAISGGVFSAEELAVHNPRRVLKCIGEVPEAIKPSVP